MRKTAISFLSLIALSAIGLAWLSHSATGKNFMALHGPQFKAHSLNLNELHKLELKASSAKSFAGQNGFDTSFCFLIDMSLPSNHNRFFIYNLRNNSITDSGLVTHGNCNEYWLEGRKYSNAVGCGCTSLGKYKVGYSYKGKFGLAFKLYGLDATNDNAFARYVVLHSHSCVPETEVESDICQSNGCPTVSPGFLKILEPLIKNSKKPILLWIFN